MKPYIPREDSLAGRLLAYFKANPDEELTPTDAAVKFDCEYHTAGAALAKLARANMLKRKPLVYFMEDE